MKEKAGDLGFTNVYTIDQVAEAWPLLDMVNHENRKTVVRGFFNLAKNKFSCYLSIEAKLIPSLLQAESYKENDDFPQIEGRSDFALNLHYICVFKLLHFS